MALIRQTAWTGTTSESKNRPMTCHTCKEKKTGVFGLDPNGRPRCFDCMSDLEKAAYAQDEGDDRGT